MKKRFSIAKFLMAVMLLLTVTVAWTNASAAWTADAGWGIAALLFVKTMVFGGSAINGHFAAIQAEVWENHIEGNLFKNNEFILSSVDAGEYVMAGVVVHIPTAGNKANVVKNRSSLPATTTTRTDTDITYPLDVYTTDPIVITDAENFGLTYNKRESVLMEHEASLNDAIGDNLLVNWAPTTNIYRTTGIPNNDESAAPVSSAAYTTGATGSRLKFGLYDLAQIALKMDKANIPANDRYGILDPNMYQQLVADMTATKYRDFSQVYNPATNTIMDVMGFKLYKRSNVLIYDNSGTPLVKAVGAASAADDNAAGLFWQKYGLERAKGTIKIFERLDDPTYYGSLYSFMVRMGGRLRRASEENVIAVVQAAA